MQAMGTLALTKSSCFEVEPANSFESDFDLQVSTELFYSHNAALLCILQYKLPCLSNGQ